MFVLISGQLSQYIMLCSVFHYVLEMTEYGYHCLNNYFGFSAFDDHLKSDWENVWHSPILICCELQSIVLKDYSTAIMKKNIGPITERSANFLSSAVFLYIFLNNSRLRCGVQVPQTCWCSSFSCLDML